MTLSSAPSARPVRCRAKNISPCESRNVGAAKSALAPEAISWARLRILYRRCCPAELPCTTRTLREQKAAAQKVAWALAQSQGAFGLKPEPLFAPATSPHAVTACAGCVRSAGRDGRSAARRLRQAGHRSVALTAGRMLAGVRGLRLQVEVVEQCAVVVHAWICGGEELVAVED